MKQHGYMIIKVRKTITCYLWGNTIEELEEWLDDPELKGCQIAKFFKDGKKEFLEIDGQLHRIQ